jgi:hypothetical protein
MGLTMTNADAALKEDYEPAMREQLTNSYFILSQIEKTSKDVEGRRVVLSLHVKRNSGVGARKTGNPLPNAGNQGYAEERVGMRRNYGRITVDGFLIKSMRSDAGSFVRAVDSESKGVVNDLRQDVNRQIWGTSDGVIAATGVTTASTTLVLAATTTEVQMRQFNEDGVYDIGTLANPTAVTSAVTVTAVNVAAKTLTLSAAVTTDATHRVYRSGSGGNGANQQELTGLQTIISDTGALFNVDPATTGVWKSTVDANGGTPRTPTETLFSKVMQKTNIAGGVDPNLWVTSDGVHRAFAANMLSTKRLVNTVDLKAGYKGIELNAAGTSTATLSWDKDAPSAKAFGISTAHIQQNQESEWEFMDEDGAILSRVAGQDAYEATLFKYHEVTTDKRNAHARIDDLTEA